jgi:hypothetical protein
MAGRELVRFFQAAQDANSEEQTLALRAQVVYIMYGLSTINCESTVLGWPAPVVAFLVGKYDVWNIPLLLHRESSLAPSSFLFGADSPVFELAKETSFILPFFGGIRESRIIIWYRAGTIMAVKRMTARRMHRSLRHIVRNQRTYDDQFLRITWICHVCHPSMQFKVVTRGIRAIETQQNYGVLHHFPSLEQYYYQSFVFDEIREKSGARVMVSESITWKSRAYLEC